MKKLFKKMVNTGIDTKTDRSDIKCIRLTNTIALLMVVQTFISMPLFIYYLPATKLLVYISVIGAVLNFVVILINYKKRYLLALTFFGSFSLIYLIIMTLYVGLDSNFHLYILCSLYLIFFVFPRRKKHIMYLFISLYALSFGGLEIWFLKYDKLLNADPLFFDAIRSETIFGLIFYVFVISYHTYQVVYNSEDELENERQKVENSNRKITDSIKYAHRIQNSLLPNMVSVKQFLPQNFFYWKPRDIVGGDIYYAECFKNGFLLAVIDCTGHGVPGALMTMVASSGLRRITIDEGCLDPADILNRLNSIIKTSLHQDTEHATSDDGLDASVCFVNTTDKTLTYAGARLPLIYINGNETTIVKGDHQSIGYKKSDLDYKFTNHDIDIHDGMAFYLYTDGIVDQLGGKKRIPFGKRRFCDLLLKSHNESFREQQNMLTDVFEKYKGDNEIQDDITVVGFSV